MRNWKIGTRIALGFAAIIVITVLLAAFVLTHVLAIEATENDLLVNYLPSINALSQVGPRADAQTTLLLDHADSSDPQSMANDEAKIAEARLITAKAFAAYEALPSSDEEKAIYARVNSARHEFLGKSDEMLVVSRLGTKVANAKARHTLDYEVRPAKTKFNAALEELIAYNLKGAGEGAVASSAAVTSTKQTVLIGAILALLVSIPIAFYIIRSITAPLAKTVAALDQLGQCDLTTTLEHDSEDEIGQMARSLNTVIATLRSTIAEVSNSASNANNSALELSAAAETIAGGTQQQAASLEETSASLQEITATLRQSADNTRQANQLAYSSRETAEQGQQVVGNAVGAMSEINAASSKISDIISTIDEIAFQTNLLAVNAAVEAARAGEQGRGFAVVAAEVRSLAQRSAAAAKEIKVLIHDTLEKVERGTVLVNKSGETLKTIVGSVKKVTDIIGEISAASEEQSTGVDQVNTAMTQIDHVTQSNSAQTEELSSTAHMLAEQSSNLIKTIGVFKLDTSRGAHLSVVSRSPQMSARHHGPTLKSSKSFHKAKPALRPNAAMHSVGTPVAAGHSNADSFEEF